MNRYIYREHLSDVEIYKKIWWWVHVQMTPQNRKLLNLNNERFRSKNRAEKIRFLIKKYGNTSSRLSMLDVGCAEGNITIRVGDYLDLKTYPNTRM